MSKKNTISEDDKNIFAAAMRGVKRIIPKKTIPPIASSQKINKINPIQKESEPSLFFSDYEKMEAVGSEDRLEFFRPGIQHKMIRNLRKGQYNAEAVLDLHGKTIEEAREILSLFLLDCQRKGIRHVIIIHGKGRSHSKPIIKNKLNHWLRQTEHVLAFCSATAQDGGTGALYILLRR
ncbi:MAG: Smr/MutS family protein [Gammaproteobacteria bacterium]|nr:Smr/MutS family protein [Gammaproteobacteria bacterium]